MSQNRRHSVGRSVVSVVVVLLVALSGIRSSAGEAGDDPPPPPDRGNNPPPRRDGNKGGQRERGGGREGPQKYSIEQAISDNAQLHTIAFSGLAFVTGDFGACTFIRDSISDS